MAELKTKATTASVTDFINAIPDEQRRKDCQEVGKASMGGSCLYIKTLDDVHRPTLRKLIAASLKQLKATARTKA
jgi:hypothetical protein